MEAALRPERPDDESFVYRLYASTRDAELGHLPLPPEAKSALLRQQFDAQRRHYAAHYADASLQIVELDGAPVGRLYVGRWEDEVRIIELSLVPEVRGRGLGSALLTTLIAEARAARLPLRIHVAVTNPAVRLYLRLGFAALDNDGVHMLMEHRGA